MDIINKVLDDFSVFLNLSFDGVLNATIKIEKEQAKDFLADLIENGYLQLIWEILVESNLCDEYNYLAPYGDGADFYPLSSRVIQPDKIATKEIIAYVSSGIELFANDSISSKYYDFIKFVSYDGYNYSQSPPFEYVLCEDQIGDKKIFSKKDVKFILVDIKGSDK